MLIGAMLTAGLLLLATFMLRRRKRGRYWAMGLAVLAALGLSLTYGKWEYLSWRYGAAFKDVAVQEFHAAQLPIITVQDKEDIRLLKVFSYREKQAELLVLDATGNKWQLHLRRGNAQEAWTSFADGVRQIEMIHSEMGGSAHRSFYWY
jgi:hypothetical protein